MSPVPTLSCHSLAPPFIRVDPCSSVAFVFCASNRADEDVGEGDEAGALEGFAGGDVRGVAAGGGDGAEGVGDALELLNQIGAEAAAAKRFVHFHVDVAVGAVVV